MNLPDRKSFTTGKIWHSTYFEKNVIAIFGKPSPKNENASSEYDKFIIQPLRALSYSGVLLSERRGNGYIYSITDNDILQFISIKERNAYRFLYHYLLKVLSDSDQLMYFETFKDKCKDGNVSCEDYMELRNKFIQFLRGHTLITQDVEIRRIFPKILNIYSYANMIQGSEKGRLSKYPYIWPNLMYNRSNWRDVDKSKGITRKEASYNVIPARDYLDYQIRKAKAMINRKYPKSEIRDRYNNGSASHVHHIFPISENPELATYLENPIKLTPTQHLSLAHPDGNTHTIGRNYQELCLLTKTESIGDSLKKGEMFYSLPNFIYVVNVGLKRSLPTSVGLDRIRQEICSYYDST